MFSWSWSGRRSLRKANHLELLTLHPLPPPSRDTLTPKRAMWDTYTADYTPSNHPSHVACSPPHDATLPPAILAAAAHENRLISTTIVRFATGHCFDTDYSERFHPGADDLTLCPCSTKDPPSPVTYTREMPRPHHSRRHTRRHTHYQHTRHHVILRCSNPEPYRLQYIGEHVTSLTQILWSEDCTRLLCSFLGTSSSSLLCSLPILCPGRDPPLSI